MKTIELSLSTNYVSHWGLREAFRELFQNAIDQGNWTWSYANNVFTIVNKDTELTPNTLLLGNTTKLSDTSKIGQFGEGYKIAALVFTRLGKEMTIYTGREVWRPRFIKSRILGEPILAFFREKSPCTSDLRIVVSDIRSSEWNEHVYNYNLHVNDKYTVLYKTSIGSVMEPIDKPSVYVNGLFVCEYASYRYSYNFVPSAISLDRDRKLVSDFDLQWLSSSIWAQVMDFIPKLALLSSDTKDANYLSYVSDYTSSKEFNNFALTQFLIQHGENAVPVATQKDAEGLHSDCKPIIVSSQYLQAITNSSYYNEPIKNTRDRLTELTEWIQKYRAYLPNEAYEEFTEIINYKF